MCGAQKGAVQGIIMFEGWAKTPEEAYALAEKGLKHIASTFKQFC